MQENPTPSSPLRAAIMWEIDSLDEMDKLRGYEKPVRSALLRFVLEHGREFAGRARPKGIRRRALKACFGNSYILASLRGFIYVEGFAAGKHEFPFHHAWCVDSEAQVIDATLDSPQDYSYFGIPLRFRFAHSRMVHGRSVGSALAPDYDGLFRPVTKEEEPFIALLGEA